MNVYSIEYFKDKIQISFVQKSYYILDWEYYYLTIYKNGDIEIDECINLIDFDLCGYLYLVKEYFNK